MRRLIGVLGVLAVVLALAGGVVQAADTLPEPVGYVNDFANVIDPITRTQLEELLKQFEDESQVELAVVTVNSLDGDSAQGYAVRLFEKWGIGKKDIDNGVLFLVAPNERKVWIEAGYGLEPYLTDGRVGRLLDSDVVPDLSQNNYTMGILKGSRAIVQVVQTSDYVPGTVRRKPIRSSGAWGELSDNLGLVFGMGLVTLYLSSYMARSKSVWLGGIWGAIMGGVLGGVLGGLLAVGIGIVAIGIAGALFDFLLTSAFRFQSTSGRSSSWGSSWGGFYGAGRGGWGGGSGGGFGGFGGGHSGGGGAGRGF